MIKFSIITVCLNAGNDLLETVESTLKQSYDEFEIIVKDGFSKDESISKLPQDKRIHVVQKKDSGIYDAMNQGIEVAQGDYLIFMNAGDRFYDSDVLECIANGIKKTPGDLYYGRCYNQILDVVDPAPKKLTKYFCYRSMICHQATIYKASMLKKRGYDVSYTVSADRERMLYAVIKEKVRCIYLPVVVVAFQGGGFCTTDKAKYMLEEEKKSLTKQYFSFLEQLKYGFRHKITLPAIRKRILQNKAVVRSYRKIISRIYGN